MRALAPDKEQRYPTALAMQTDLDSFLGISGTQLRSRDIGAVVCRLFADRRDQTEAIVADQLARLATLSEGQDAALQLVDLPRISLASDVTPLPEPAARRRGLPLVAALLGVLLAALGASAMLWIAGGERAEPAETPAAPSVEVRITAFPAGATIALDGVALGTNPHRQTYARSAEPHELRVTAPGYEVAVRSLTLEAAADIVIALKALPPEATSASAPDAGAAPPGGKGSPRSATVRPGCDPPAYFDAKGIKHFKPQCL